ncbi:MAG: BamA/TamA family outer membrane protein [Ignavibacteriales bacterium]|nr:BamA/TamA family outer membrane protein [Ignavibacteriales bacterium]MCB9220016.1 BamA/TamA family outer membrane protein [Ignavibacteriales bacterium]
MFSSLVFAQTVENKDEILIATGSEYEAGALHNFFFGKHWRDVWTTPLNVKILDLDKFAGGLTPIKKGGGFQTKSLRFKGNDGHYWKFRSIEKDPSKTLPPELRESIADDILQDQISSSNPYAAFVVAPILDSLNILQARPLLYYMPDVEQLGEFRDEFGGMLGILEIHPDVEEEENISFEEANKIEGTLDLFERLEKKEDEYVNSKEYLKARLVDIFLGDWDRHADQWKWARYNDGNKKVWLPIPRDRDQVFAKFDGLLPSVAEYLIPQFNSFENSYNDIEFLTWNGRFVDQHFLVQLTKDEWDSVTTFVQQKLTDDLINSAVKELPQEVYPISEKEIFSKLKSRRNQLKEISDDYYNFINTVVDIYGNEDDDYVEINRIDNNKTSLKIYKDIKKEQLNKYEPYFTKIFDNNITDEIRIYLLEGDDLVKIIGEVDQGIMIRIVGGDGADEIIDSSVVDGYFLSVIPIPDSEHKTKIYDSGKKTKITYRNGTIYDDDKIKEPKDQEEKYRPSQQDRSSRSYFLPVIGYSTDDGITIGAGETLYQYGFRAIPFKNKFIIEAEYATEPKAGSINFTSVFNSVLKNISFNFNLAANGLKYTKYYGYGNETNLDDKLEENDNYRLEQTLFSVNPSFHYFISQKSNINLGLEYSFSNSELKNETLLDQFPLSKYSLGKFESMKTNIDFNYDSRDNDAFARHGFYANGSFYFSPNWLDNKYNYSGTKLDLRTYFTSILLSPTTFAFRIFGEKIWGKYPFLSSVFLGGSENLMGFNRERFSGDASLYGTAQIRTHISKIKLIINGDLGFHTFAETGRVFTEDNNSNLWHPSFGGGLWLSYLQRKFNIVTTVAKSKESFLIYFGLGFNF